MNKKKVTYKELTAQEWADKRKWSNFLRAIPLNDPISFAFATPTDLIKVKVTAYMMNSNPKCDREFSIKNPSADMCSAVFTAALKPTQVL